MKEDKNLSVIADGDYQVGVVTEISPELLAEGIAREIVRRLQTMRRSAGLEISDHIQTYYEGGEQVQAVMKDFADYIKQETLSTAILQEVCGTAGAYGEVQAGRDRDHTVHQETGLAGTSGSSTVPGH